MLLSEKKSQLISLTRLFIFMCHLSIANLKGAGKADAEFNRCNARRLQSFPDSAMLMPILRNIPSTMDEKSFCLCLAFPATSFSLP
jgi:hypothetical protein